MQYLSLGDEKNHYEGQNSFLTDKTNLKRIRIFHLLQKVQKVEKVQNVPEIWNFQKGPGVQGPAIMIGLVSLNLYVLVSHLVQLKPSKQMNFLKFFNIKKNLQHKFCMRKLPPPP